MKKERRHGRREGKKGEEASGRGREQRSEGEEQGRSVGGRAMGREGNFLGGPEEDIDQHTVYSTQNNTQHGNTYHSNINRIIIIQKRSIRLLFGACRLDHTTPLFQRANALKFTELVKLNTAVFIYKAYHCMLPENRQRDFVKNDIMHLTRTNSLSAGVFKCNFFC